ncbi:NAD(P)-binding domain-containing protein [Nocardia sp. 2]|uniref:NAD(P)-binding domain-containing protein n=1 Tax=Nocardia acididurans TaxID=2802282 RepID=A0ABS1MC92_9NOCA|nr:NAD(P)-binding domain-containing protein [Nocardia acididurans]MBL1078176.1 NAD(P)-binding domain-containing protein [Nocardia acididurans]
MDVGIFGAGHIGLSLAGLFDRAGHTVHIASRHLEQLSKLLLDRELHRTRAESVEKVAAAAELLVGAVQWTQLEDLTAELPPIDGKIWIDPANPIAREADGTVTMVDTGTRPTSAIVADLVPKAQVVKAFNSFTTPMYRSGPLTSLGRIVAPIAGDHPAALSRVGELIKSTGFVPIVIGNIEDSVVLQPGGALRRLSIPMIAP